MKAFREKTGGNNNNQNNGSSKGKCTGNLKGKSSHNKTALSITDSGTTVPSKADVKPTKAVTTVISKADVKPTKAATNVISKADVKHTKTGEKPAPTPASVKNSTPAAPSQPQTNMQTKQQGGFGSSAKSRSVSSQENLHIISPSF